jgi:hypothetical protein
MIVKNKKGIKEIVKEKLTIIASNARWRDSLPPRRRRGACCCCSPCFWGLR